jgi:hypothetical protein
MGDVSLPLVTKGIERYFLRESLVVEVSTDINVVIGSVGIPPLFVNVDEFLCPSGGI